MKMEETMHKLRSLCVNQNEFPKEVLDWIAEENLWNLWIPKSYGGLEMPLSKGLEKLRSLAEIDGSLGWTVTLCSGANFFLGNLQEHVADSIFLNPKTPVCFGGSGGVFGTAEKKDGGYIISGTWKYATGAPYLSHFTLNAKIVENGKELKDEKGDCLVRSFVIDKKDVEIIEDWNAMGLKATATHSFQVKEKWVDEKFRFIYNKQYHDHAIFKIDFSVFADLTLWVNYIGVASHFLEEAQKVNTSKKELGALVVEIENAYAKINQYASQIEETIDSGNPLPEIWVSEIHKNASMSVKKLSEAIIKIYPLLGIKGCSENHVLNHIFKDYFTATQHHIFSRQ
ncbi:acyl-CoA dehydrogenase family protein [Marixanthotalea marina]|uniref:acyl-CoA dehydrogenase n=1 Tax=Marixanthotalea marina TaxID=2844359 RepID=UPI002989E3D8|nr:acyl-CoA dehydrogenase [Marixanthotalea marina]